MTATPRLAARSLSLGYDDRTVVDALDLDVLDGRVTAIVGANACGKSTLLRGLARLLRPSSGEVLLDGTPILDRASREVARVLGLLPQTPVAPDGITVADLVARGRHPHQGWFRSWSTGDEAAVAAALDATDTVDLVDRPLHALSGGQRQRVWIAMALAQETDLLLLDEPTTYLDISPPGRAACELLTRPQPRPGRTVVAVLHDLNLACALQRAGPRRRWRGGRRRGRGAARPRWSPPQWSRRRSGCRASSYRIRWRGRR
jgi:iron complex transport system ATP-binding protein